MQKIQKSKDPILYEMQYNHIKNFKSISVFYLPLIAISLCLYGVKLYQLVHIYNNPQIHPNMDMYKNTPFFTLFIVQIIILLATIVIAGVSLYVSSMNNILVYMLLLMQAVGVVYVQTTMQCFNRSQWCKGEIKYQVGAIIVICVYAAIVYLRSTIYYPFYDNYVYLSMASSSIILFDFAYKLLFGLVTNLQSAENIQSQRKFMILITIALYAVYNATKFYSNPLINNSYLIVYTFLAWTTLVAYLLPYFDVISTMRTTYHLSTQTLFWYLWGYSTPCLIVYVIIANFSIDPNNGWKALFLQKKHQIKDLQNLYLITSQFKVKLKYLKKSQQKANDPLFKTIWGLIVKHNQFCDHTECPLQQLKTIQIHRNDDFLQQKRLLRTIQCCYSFGLYHLQRKKDRFPNLLQLSVEIANYELQVFQNRQKGLVLYTQFYGKQDIDSNEKFMLYYLKKKIEEMFIDNENYTKTNRQNEISQFRHNIEVSVSMLAEFWYFLADPKCNLKKLYDLANVLFPLKIGVDNQWKNIQKLKNIESYNLYARYLIKMFNDKQKGLKILDQAKKIQHELKNREQVQVDAQGNTNIGVQENGIIFLQFDGKNPGVMYQVNLAAERIFGYNKGELVNRKVNDIMPKLFAIQHDKILQNYQQTNKARMMNKQRVAWGKSKDGYLFPFIILIKPVKNLLSQSSQVYASVKRQTWVKESGFLTIDLQDQISEVSASMLGIFPQLYGKVNLKKKMHITQIIPNFTQLKEKMLDEKQGVAEFQLTRQFSISEKQKFKQTTTFNLSLNQISFTVSGLVGFIVKFTKTLIASNGLQQSQLQQSQVQQQSQQQKQMQLSNIRESRLKQNHFRFIYNINEFQQQVDQNNGIDVVQRKTMIRYKGGIVHDMQQMAKSCVNSASRFFTKLPIQQQKQIEQRQRIDYSEGIRTKRLVNKQIRQIHLLSQQSQYDAAQVQKQLQQQLGYVNIKPSQLSSILQKQTSNRHIFCLKLITLFILLSSSLLCIIEYINLLQHRNMMIDSNEKVRKLNQLSAEILYMKMQTTQFSYNQQTQQQLEMFTEQINLLDQYLDYYALNINTNLVYNDGSSDNMILGFALNKLISQANSIKSSTTTYYNQSDSHVYFVDYNTINGLYISINNENIIAVGEFYACIDNISSIEIIYICVAVSVFLVAMVGKNILLRIVLKKKSQILQVFFQIPRKACTSIQKQCQRFIQRLSSQNQQDMESLSMASQTSQNGFTEQKKSHKQKKRTVMGEQKTTNHYIIATVAFLLVLMFFHIFSSIYHSVNKADVAFTMQASQMIFKLEQQASLTTNLMNSFVRNKNIPLLGRGVDESSTVIKEQFESFSQLYGDLAVKFYLIGNILDSDYLNNYNQLSYQDLCQIVNKTAQQCDKFYGQNYGLNVVLSQYFNVIKDKYLQIKTGLQNDGVINSTQQQKLLNNTRLQSQRTYICYIFHIGKAQYLLKQHWRTLTEVLHTGQQRLITHTDTIMFAIMLTVCVSNFTILLFCWLKFYHSLEQKIAATEYILTFIPIDQINRNPKIANYIKEEILEKR